MIKKPQLSEIEEKNLYLSVKIGVIKTLYKEGFITEEWLFLLLKKYHINASKEDLL